MTLTTGAILVIVFTCLIIIAVIGGGYHSYREHRDKKASQQFHNEQNTRVRADISTRSRAGVFEDVELGRPEPEPGLADSHWQFQPPGSVQLPPRYTRFSAMELR
jgi:hypothetical protein